VVQDQKVVCEEKMIVCPVCFLEKVGPFLGFWPRIRFEYVFLLQSQGVYMVSDGIRIRSK
jgi:hypothetical protein